MSKFGKVVVLSLFIMFVCIVMLFFLQFQNNNSLENINGAKSNSSILIENGNIINNLSDQNQASLSAQIKNLNSKIIFLETSVSGIMKRLDELENTVLNSKINTSANQIFQKQSIYIGSASTNNNVWTDSGVEVNLDSNDYPSYINAVFEVGISIVSGEASARLVNKTTGSIMAITEVAHSSSNTTWKTSPKFKLHPGNNTYSLQIRSSSSETANFSGSRIVLDK
ncbi:MAG: hypothetical protein H6772_04105 [Pseudomonadales bacterium]|nr:hypothetical protein [Pseudomonadales bacterium]